LNLDLWNLEKGKVQQALLVAAAVDLGAAFSPDERRVAVADFSLDQTQRILLWDLQTSKSRVLWSEKKKNTSFITIRS
jgi:Tol biopolymer transport system component